MKVKGVAVLVVQVLVVCSAFPSRLDNLGKDVDDFVKETMKLALGPLAQVLNLPEMNSFMKMPMRMAIIKPLSLQSHHTMFHPLHLTREHLASNSSRSLIEKHELPLPVIPNMDVTLAPFRQPGQHLLGILPKDEPLPSFIVKVDDIQIPETMQLVLAYPSSFALPSNFEALVVVLNDKPLPNNGRILSYHFRHLKIPSGGFASSSNANLVAIRVNSEQFVSTPYLCLSLLRRSYGRRRLPFARPMSPRLPSTLVAGSNLVVPPAIPLPPLVPGFMALYSLSLAESNLIHSLKQMIENDPNAKIFFPPAKFQISLVYGHCDCWENQYPIGLVPKGTPPSSSFIEMPRNLADHYQDVWTDFRMVAYTKLEQQPTPPYFQPIIYRNSDPRQPFINSNGVPLPINGTETDPETGKVTPIYGVLIRNITKPVPIAGEYLIVTLTPEIPLNDTRLVEKNNSSDSDVLDYPAMQPRLFASTTTVKSTTVIHTTESRKTVPTTTKPTTTVPSTHKPTTTVPSTHKPSTTVPSTHKPTTTVPSTHKPTTIVSSTQKPSNDNVKPLPSKKSWKNRLPYTIQPSVKVVKRVPAEQSNLSFLPDFLSGFFL